MKKFLAVLLSIFMVLSVSACGSKSKAGDAGKYNIYEMSAEGMTFDNATLKTMGMNEMITLELKEDGTGTVDFGDGPQSLTWKSGTITLGGTDVPYTSKDGKITFEYMGTKAVFERVGDASEGGAAATSETGGGKTGNSGDVDLEIGSSIFFSNFEIVYKGASLGTSWDDKDVVVVTVDFINNSDSANSYGYEAYQEATQKGASLDATSSIMTASGEVSLLDTEYTEIEPGKTTEVKFGFELQNLTDEVTIDVMSLYADAKGTITLDLTSLGSGGTTGGGSAALGNTLEGDWYGWWIVTDATGGYADSNNNWWDICATISYDGGNTATMKLWDEDYARDDLLGTVTLNLTDDRTATSASGMFANDKLGDGDWEIDLDLDDYPDAIVLSDYYEDKNGSFTYGLYMHRWGAEWTEPEDNLPYYYSDWYLPLIQKGESMPDKIN